MDANEKAYAAGHQAYHDGYGRRANPHKRGSELWEEWRKGWQDEKADDPYWEKVKYYKRKTNKA